MVTHSKKTAPSASNNKNEHIDKAILAKIEKAKQKLKENRLVSQDSSQIQKLSKADKKAIIRAKKLELKPHYDKILKVNFLWEEFRSLRAKGGCGPKKITRKRKLKQRELLPGEKKQQAIIESILRELKGRMEEASYRADASRVLQGVIKYGSTEQFAVIYGELQGKVLTMANNQYGNRVVKKLFKYCADKEVREKLFAELQGKVLEMLMKRYSADIIEQIYTDNETTKAERLKLVREFYGSSFTYGLDQSDDADGITQRSLADMLQSMPNKRAAVVAALSQAVKKYDSICYLFIIRVISKGFFDLTVVHRLLADAFEVCESGDVQEMIDDMSEANALPFILHTKNGCKASIYCIAYASAAARKQIIKSLKENLLKACEDSFGFLVVLKLLEVTDDTVLVKKSLLKELELHFLKLSTSQYGSKVLLQLLRPNSTKYIDDIRLALINPSHLRPIGNAKPSEGSTQAIQLSKKDPQVIRQEHMNELKSHFWKLATNHALTLICDVNAVNVYFEIMSRDNVQYLGDEDTRTTAIERLAALVLDPNQKLLFTPSVSQCVSRLILQEQTLDVTSKPSLTMAIFKPLKGQMLESITSLHSAFTLAALITNKTIGKEVYSELSTKQKQLLDLIVKDRGAKLLGLKVQDFLKK